MRSKHLDIAIRLYELAERAPSIAPELLALANQVEADPSDPEDLTARNRLLAVFRRKYISRIAEDRSAARVMEKRLVVYEQGSWRKDRHANVCPYETGTPSALLWEILKAGPSIKAEQIRKLKEWGVARPITQVVS